MLRQLGGWSGRGAVPAAQFAATNRVLPALYAVSPKGRATTPMPAAALHPWAAQDGAWGTCFQHWSLREGSRYCHVLPCCHFSLRPWHLQSMENNSCLSTHVGLFFKGMSPPNGNNFLLHFQPSVLNIERELIEHI